MLFRIRVDTAWSRNWEDCTRKSKTAREATLTQEIGIENPIISSNSESNEETIMTLAPPLQTMEDYCKRTDAGQISNDFEPTDPTKFDIKNNVLSGLRDNPFDGNAIRDSWVHLARFHETFSMCRATNVTGDQVNMRLLGFSLITRSKDWLLCLSNGNIRTLKELEDKFLERFLTVVQFTERKAEVTNFEQQETKSSYVSWERFKLLLWRGPNHNLISIDQMKSFIKVLRS